MNPLRLAEIRENQEPRVHCVETENTSSVDDFEECCYKKALAAFVKE